VVERSDGSLLMDGAMLAADAFERLEVTAPPDHDDFHTLAGYVLFKLGRLPSTGESMTSDGWRFEIVDMDGRRIDKLLVTREASSASS
jgi:putative hemolysin